VADHDAARGAQILNVAEAQVEPKVQPQGMGGDLTLGSSSPDRAIGQVARQQTSAIAIADPHST
jgi:hypothetical protein